MKKSTRNAFTMKTANMREIISILRQGPVSRADLARATGLTRAAVTIIVERLVKNGLVTERGTGESRQGKKPILLDIVSSGLCFMGVDITRVDCSIGVVDIKGKILAHDTFRLSPDGSFDDLLLRVVSGLRSLRATLPDPGSLLGMGVSVPGPVDSNTGNVLNPPNFGMLCGRNVLEPLKDALGCGVWIDNNAAARALYEKDLGAGRSFTNFISMIVDTGVGSGLVLGGRLFRGLGFAGEAGHMSVDMNGKLCTCGNRGCLELYAAIPALIRRECAGRPDIAGWSDVVDRAAEGDALCLSVIEKEARYLSQSVVNTTNLLDLEAVILTGFVTYKPGLLLDAMSRFVQGARIAAGAHRLEILASGSIEHVGVVSAAMLAAERFLTGETDWDISG
ncbi:MAG: ROK family transcriptional regulator [Clostridiaceae bacterium]|nr:ROK family transcriptional regulator [Clostridiaceae bacterium]